ncbi:hypothetical protein [uncultured Tenacibaculum sp.]|uniref:hypothetical protein n=1 Tax=uncultured Tenacibaculum sp. TaxID=174713 RepID=UPI00263483AA|nr:hypothetical protein [uncultured Tenacibaculum sp.]
MELANIEKLLEKYLNAETTLQEEDVLRAYFTTASDVPSHLEEYGMLFGYFKQSQNETFTKTIKLKPEKQKRRNFKWLSVAASFALLVSVYTGKKVYDDIQTENQIAQVREALRMVSYNLNKGNDALYSVSNNYKKGTEAIAKLDTYDKAVKTALEKINN